LFSIFRRKKQKQQQQQQQEPLQQLQPQQQQAVPVQHFAEQHPEHAVPKGRFLVPDIPSGQLVLALNLMAYWAITNQSRRSSMGGSMTG
jgi:glucose/arabinose dehydrogenase